MPMASQAIFASLLVSEPLDGLLRIIQAILLPPVGLADGARRWEEEVGSVE